MQTVGVNEFQGLNVPLITIEQFLENGTGAVECDNIQGGCLAAEHLIAQGCRHLIHISGVHETAMPADERAAGFREVCEQKNVQYQVVGTHAYEYWNTTKCWNSCFCSIRTRTESLPAVT